MSFFIGSSVQANTALVDVNLFYLSNALVTTSSTTNARTLYALTLGYALDKKGQYFIGWNYNIAASTDSTTTSTTYGSTDMGPKFVWFIDKNQIWSLGLAYNLIANATYTPAGGTGEKWSGSSLLGELGYAPPLTEMTRLGFKLTYYAASYKQVVVATTVTDVAYTQSWIVPSLYFAWFF